MRLAPSAARLCTVTVFFDAVRSVSPEPVEPARGGSGALNGMAFHEPKLPGHDFIEELGF